jgi:hypothetical protein
MTQAHNDEASGDSADAVTEANQEIAIEQIEIFVHASGNKPVVALATAEETLREVLVRSGLEAKIADHHVFVGECEEALSETIEVEDGVDEHAAVDIDLKLVMLEVGKHGHVHVHHCRHIKIGVNFGADTKHHRFSPNTTIGVATEWARKKFNLDRAVACEYVLQLCGSSVQPRSDEHLGDIVKDQTCTICFDLVKEITPKG